MYWRVRLRVGAEHDFSDDAWERNEVGIWYGAWTADDLNKARRNRPQEVRGWLNGLASQRALGWDITPGHFSSVERFERITEADWVLIYLARSKEIGLAKIGLGLSSDKNHPFDNWADNGEIFKYRKITTKKTFKISDLPDAYRLLPSQGRSNVHQFHAMHDHVALLADSLASKDVQEQVQRMPFENLLDFLGASGWESFCVAYLILEQQFVPTGLSVGRTLRALDIVGRRAGDGRRILAQCKKNSTPQAIDGSFVDTITSSDLAFYFAYSGVAEVAPKGINVVTGADVRTWVERSANGQAYRKLLLADA